MNKDEKNQHEYKTRVMVFMTDFKENFCVAPMHGFNPKRFVGTREEYDLKMTPWFETEEKGKPIGLFTEEFNFVDNEYSRIQNNADADYLKMRDEALRNEKLFRQNNKI